MKIAVVPAVVLRIEIHEQLHLIRAQSSVLIALKYCLGHRDERSELAPSFGLPQAVRHGFNPMILLQLDFVSLVVVGCASCHGKRHYKTVAMT
jgi:hypothetical protein